MARVFYCLPSDILSYAATWSLTSGTANSAFPLANLNSVRADRVSKLNETSGTYRGTISSHAVQAVAFINCNLPGLTIPITNNNAMASTNLIIPAASPDNLSINGFVDLRAVTTAATQWNAAVPVNSANVAVGKILLIGTLREMVIRWRPRMPERKPNLIQRTDRDVALGFKLGVRYRQLAIALMRESQRAAYTTLRRGSSGPQEPFLFILDTAVNDPMYVWFPQDEWTHQRESSSVTTWDDLLEEVNPGLAL